MNRRARRLAEEGSLLDVLRAERPDHRVVETWSLADLTRVAEDIARDEPDVVVIAGGDGSYMAGVTALARACAAAGERPLPRIALAPGGTVSTVARNWGFEGGGLLSRGAVDRERYAARLYRALLDGTFTTTSRPTLRVEDDSEETGDAHVGFIFGAGLVSRFFEVYEAEGERGYAGAASIVARVFAGSFARGSLAAKVLTPVACSILVDGEKASLDRASLVAASVVRDLGLGLHVLHRAAEANDRFHVVATPLGPAMLGPQMPLVLLGRRLLGRANVDQLAARFTLRFTEGRGAYVLDGELFHAGEVTLTPGPVLAIVSA